MKAALERLRAEVRSDRAAVDRWFDALEQSSPERDDPASCAQAAWALHHAYTGIESILLRVMRGVEGELPIGPDFHKEALEGAALILEEIRPALLSAETVRSLHDLLAFRHFVRHAYAVELESDRLADLKRRAASLRPGLGRDLDRLESWLETLARAEV